MPARPTRRAGIRFFGCTLLLLTAGAPAIGQETGGSAGRGWAGAALGMSTGAVLANVGTIVPCTETSFGARCIATATLLGAALGGVSGGLVGASDSGTLSRRAASAGVGVGAGVVVALVGRPFFQRVGWADVVAVGLIGGTIGSQPRGALVGAGVGGAIGLALWPTLPGFEMPDAVGALLGGVTVGVLGSWVADASDARRSRGDPVRLAFRIGF